MTVNFYNVSTPCCANLPGVTDYNSYSWVFGDGNTSTNVSPTNTYSTAGNYTVSLTASGPCGTNTVTYTNVISVSP